MLRILVLYLILVACFSYVFEHTFGMFFVQYCALNKSQYLPTRHRRHLYVIWGNGSSQVRLGLAPNNRGSKDPGPSIHKDIRVLSSQSKVRVTHGAQYATVTSKLLTAVPMIWCVTSLARGTWIKGR